MSLDRFDILPRHIQYMARCLDCEHMHQPEKGRDLYFCLKTRDYIDHKVEDLFNCQEFKEAQPRSHAP